jgi:mycothiol system anti-sigma-R factor
VSCGEPHKVDCSEVLAEVWMYLDAEGDESGRERIAEHLDECSPCLREFGIEQEVKALVARCCGGEVAPAGLRQRLITTIREAMVTEDGVAIYSETSVEVRREA